MDAQHHKQPLPTSLLVTHFYLEEGIASAVADITRTDHIHTPSHTCPLDNSYHRLRTLCGQEIYMRCIVTVCECVLVCVCVCVSVHVCVCVCVCVCARVEGEGTQLTFSKEVKEFCIDFICLFSFIALRATSSPSSELVLLKKS